MTESKGRLVREGIVYALMSDAWGPVVKIGRTGRDVQQRVRDLQTGCPTEIRIVCAVAVEDSVGAEKIAHRKLSHLRIRNEFFRCEDPVMIRRILSSIGKFEGESIPEKIMAHKKEDDGSLYFKVKWQSDEEMTWEPYVQLAHLKILKEYLVKNLN